MFSYTKKMMMSHRCLLFFIIIFFFILYLPPNYVNASQEDDAISKWAEKFGEELWELGKRMTKSTEIKAKYKEYNARVERKDGNKLIKSIVQSIGRMLSRKMDAVRCILATAEREAEKFDLTFNETYALNEFQYYSSKYSMFDDHRGIEDILPSIENNLYMYKNMSLNQDTHFYNISVNTSYSSVHVPSNIWDRNLDVLRAIMWSEELDTVFQQNYKADPALSWQYFGSDTGILRHYPALQWEVHEKADTYDCRKRSWYIETATCSKDIVILLDSSGSMHGFRYHIAKFTIRSILDTFSNNDFFTILKYSKNVYDVVPCFKDVLVQATPENIKIFNEALADNSSMEGYADLPKAYEAAFELLKKYYIQRRCNESETGCNQAIMLVTDGVAGNTTEVFEKYNWESGSDNSTTKLRVRVFTYLLGKEVTKVREIQWMACLNRGYYSHVQTLDEVHEEVLKYVNVIATPLVLQNDEHPPTWTHAFTDKTYEQEDDDQPPRLMIAVGIPAFDRSYMEQRNDTRRRARLLGVAGTDVPVEDIDKLALPYKLGVNGYAFVVSNNGYVMLHPDLRPVVTPRTFSNDPQERHKGVLNINYNSIDLTEIEQLQSQDEPREPEETLIELRRSMVMYESGNFIDVPVKFHYDKMRRVSPESQDYFYAPLPKTPFSLGLVLPSKYGKTWIKVGDEVKRNQHMNINITNYFLGQNWKIHPDWVYCKYHYLEGHEYKTPELELVHFLNKLNEPGWKWSEQYESESSPDDNDIRGYDEPNCGRKTLDDDAYYCNKELVQLLIFDAKVTNASYGTWKFTDDYERELILKYNATLRFVATMSGLTRWQFIFGEVEKPEDKEFGDYHTTAIDETWYKSAILQHSIDPDSFVYTVPHNSDPPEEGGLQITASHAIFPKDGGLEAPGCVVGFQFSHDSFYERFVNITSEDHCNGCMETCGSDIINCYVIDNNGYVLVSSTDDNSTGTYFGEIEGDIMEKLIEDDIFKVIPVYDTQAVCRKVDLTASHGSKIYQSFEILALIIKWIITEFMWFLGRLNLWVQGIPFYEDLEPDFNEHHDTHRYHEQSPTDELPKIEIKPIYIDDACDTQSNLVILQQDLFMKGNDLNTEIISTCNRPFHIKRIPKSNLILIVVNSLYRRCDEKIIRASPEKIEYINSTWPCHKLNLSFYERRRLEECYTEHANEAEYTYCGDATSIQLKLITAVMSAITVFGFSIAFLFNI